MAFFDGIPRIDEQGSALIAVSAHGLNGNRQNIFLLPKRQYRLGVHSRDKFAF